MLSPTLVFCCVAVAVNSAAPVLLDSHHLFSVANPSYSLEIPYPSARTGYFASPPVDTRVFSDASEGAFVVISDPAPQYPHSSNLLPAVPPISLVQNRYGAFSPGQVTLLNTFRSGILLDGFQTPIGPPSPLESSISHINPAFGSGGIPPTGSFSGGSRPASREFPQGRGGPGGFPGGPQVPHGSGFPGSPEGSGAFQQGLSGLGGLPGGPQVPAPRGGAGFPGGPEGSGAIPRGHGGAEGQHGSTSGTFLRGPSSPGGFLGGPEPSGTFSHGIGTPEGIGNRGPGSRPGEFHLPQGPGARSGDYGPLSSTQGAHGGRPHGPPGSQQ